MRTVLRTYFAAGRLLDPALYCTSHILAEHIRARVLRTFPAAKNGTSTPNSRKSPARSAGFFFEVFLVSKAVFFGREAPEKNLGGVFCENPENPGKYVLRTFLDDRWPVPVYGTSHISRPFRRPQLAWVRYSGQNTKKQPSLSAPLLQA